MNPTQEPSAAALGLIGKIVTHDDGRRTRHGVVTAAEKVYAVITDRDGIRWTTVRFRIKPSDGSRAFWTCGMPDRLLTTPEDAA